MADMGSGAREAVRARTGQLTVAVPGTAQQLPDVQVLNRFALVVKARRANGGTIRLGGSQADAQNPAVAFTLLANEPARLYVDNANRIWVDGTLAGDGIEWLVEGTPV